MKKIAVIHDLSGLGKCSLTAAIPVISAMGVQACPLPTAILSNQTGYGSYFWDDYTDRMELIMDEWKKTGFTPDGVYTGFLGDARQVDLILKFVDMFCTEGTHILVDPVMGDRGETYKPIQRLSVKNADSGQRSYSDYAEPDRGTSSSVWGKWDERKNESTF